MDSRIPVFVGVDYAEEVSQVVVLDEQGRELGTKRLPSRLDRLTAYAAGFGEVRRAAVEACNGTATLADELAGAGWPIQLAHPGFVRRMKHQPDKTDYSDARVLADLTRVGYLPEVWLAPPAVRELRRVTRGRQALVEQARQVKLRIRALLRELRIGKPAWMKRVWTVRGVAWLKTLADSSALPPEASWVLRRHLYHLAFFEDELALYARHLETLAANDPAIQRLLAHKGVGLITACVLRAEIGRFERFHTGKQLAHYCGVSPHNASSGQRQADAGLVRGGNQHLKLALIELSHRLKRYDPQWAALAARLRAAGKPACVIVAAVANRWVRKLYYEMSAAAAAA